MTEATSKPISRRTVAKGAAWTAPVVTLGVAAPMAAASPPPVNPTLGAESCKHTEGVKRYHVQLVFKNGLNCATNVVMSKFVVISNSGQTVTFTPPPLMSFSIPRYSELSWTYDSDEMGNISQGNVQVVYTYTDCDGQVVSEDQTISVGQLPPCTFPYPHNSSTSTTTSSTSTSGARKAEATSTTTAPTEPAPTSTAAPTPTSTTAPAAAPASTGDATTAP